MACRVKGAVVNKKISRTVDVGGEHTRDSPTLPPIFFVTPPRTVAAWSSRCDHVLSTDWRELGCSDPPNSGPSKQTVQCAGHAQLAHRPRLRLGACLWRYLPRPIERLGATSTSKCDSYYVDVIVVDIHTRDLSRRRPAWRSIDLRPRGSYSILSGRDWFAGTPQFVFTDGVSSWFYAG